MTTKLRANLYRAVFYFLAICLALIFAGTLRERDLPYEWPTTLFLLVALSWITSSKSPFIWISRIAIQCETVRLGLIESVVTGYRFFVTSYRAREAAVKAGELKPVEMEAE